MSNKGPIEQTPVDSGIEEGIEWRTATAPIRQAINGYVKLPKTHPWRVADIAEQFAEVNGGITYGPTDDGWIGFDTLHSGDYWPGGLFDYREGDIEWTPELVAEETRKLARQVAAALAEDVAFR